MTVENLHDAIGQLPSDLIAKVDEKRCRKRTVIPFRRYAAMAACLAVILGCSLFLTRLLAPKGGSTESVMLQAADESNRVEAPAAAAPQYDEAPTEAPAAMEPECEEAAPEAPAAVTGEGSAEPEEPTAEISADDTMLQFDYPINLRATQYADTQNIGTINASSNPEIRLLSSQSELDAFREDFGCYDLDAFNVHCNRYDASWFEQHDLLIVLLKGISANSSTKVTSMLDLDDNGIWELCISYSIPYEDSAQRSDRFVLMEATKNTITNEESIVIIME